MKIDYEKVRIETAKRIRAIRVERGMTIQELADRCEIESSNMGRIELGNGNITLKTICKVCNALDISISDLFKTE